MSYDEKNKQKPGDNMDETHHEESFVPKVILNQEIDDKDFQFNQQMRPKTSQPVQVASESRETFNLSNGSATIMAGANNQ